jgi:hypothetical protein
VIVPAALEHHCGSGFRHHNTQRIKHPL